MVVISPLKRFWMIGYTFTEFKGNPLIKSLWNGKRHKLNWGILYVAYGKIQIHGNGLFVSKFLQSKVKSQI